MSAERETCRIPRFRNERSEAKGGHLERQGTDVPQSRKMVEGSAPG